MQLNNKSTINHIKNMNVFNYFWKNGTVKIGGQYLNELEYYEINKYKTIKLPKGNSLTITEHILITSTAIKFI